MYSYSLQYLRQLDNSTCYRSNNTSCTRFRKDLDFWFPYGVPLCSLYGFDICINLLLPRKLLISILQPLLSQTCLISFWKMLWYNKTRYFYFILKHKQGNTYWNKIVKKHNRVQFPFFLQKRDFSAAWEVPWVWQTRVFMEEEHSPCLLLRPTQ